MLTTAIVGVVSACIGVMLGQGLSAYREHSEWVKDQKRLEYRQLLDQLYETIIFISQNCFRPGCAAVIDESEKKLARVFADRIFIADQLKESGVLDDWTELKKVMCKPVGEVAYAQDLNRRGTLLVRKIMELVRADIVKFKFFGLIEE
jgi:hypothetical protein